MENKANEEKLEPEQSVNQNKKVSGKKGIKIAWKIIEKIIMIVIIFISLIIVTQRLTNNEKSFLGYRIFRVETGSMIPKYQIGDVIIVKEKEIGKIAVGDDVTYWGTTGTMKGKLVTHQVVDIEEIEGQTAFHTKGIANNTEDPIVYANQINGVVQGKLYVMTGITRALANQYVFYFCGIIPLTIFVFLAFVRSNNKKFEEYK